MKRLRRHLGPLATDTISPLNLPPVRMGLLTKLNLLTVGLIFLTAIATTGFYLWQKYRVEDSELRSQGSTMVTMLAEMSESGFGTNDRKRLDAVLDNLNPDDDIAYVCVLDANRQPILERRFTDSLRNAELPALARDAPLPAPGAIGSTDYMIQGRRYIELIAPIASLVPTPAARIGDANGDVPAETAGVPCARPALPPDTSGSA